MKAAVLILCSLIVFTSAWSQVPVLYYDFESNAARTTLETTPEQSINTGSSMVDRYYNPPTPITIAATGNGLAYGGLSAGTALTSNKWPTGDPGVYTKDYYSFNSSTVGFSGLTLSFDARADQSGMSVAVAWGTGLSGAAPTVYTASSTGALTVPSNGFSKLQFTLPATAENQAELYIKIYAFNAANSVATTLTIDNLSLNTTTISATKTLLDYAAVGSSLTSGTAYEPTYNNLTVSGPGSVVTLGGNLRLQGTLNLAAGILALGSSTLSMNGTISKTGGIINATTGTMAFGGSSPQTISPAWFSGAIKNLTINNAQGVTATGDLAVSNVLALTAGTFALGTTSLSIGGEVSRGTGVMNATSATVTLNGTATQTIAAGIFSGSVKNLTINNTAGVTTAADATITGTLSLTAGTYNIGSSTQTLAGSVAQTSGNINATAGTMVYNGSVAQTLAPAHYTGAIKNLTVSNAAGLSLTGNLTVSNNTVLTAGTLTVGSATLSIGGSISRTTGSISTPSGTIVFNGSMPQTIAAGVFSSTVNNLTINNAAGVSTTADATITGTLTITAGTYNAGTTTQTITGNITRAGGTIDASAAAFVFNGSVAQTIAAGTFQGSIKNLTVSNTAGVTTAADITVGTALTLTTGTFSIGSSTLTLNGSIVRTSGLLNISAGTLVMGGTTAQSLPVNAITGSINNLTINNAAGVSTTADATITGTLTLTAGTYNAGATTQTIKGNISRTAGTMNVATGNLIFSGTAAQNIAAGAFLGTANDVTVNNAAGVSTAADLVIGNTLNLSAGTYNIGASTQTITGSINRTGGTMNATEGTIVFNGTAAQSVPSGSVSTTIKNLTVNNVAGLTVNDNFTIATALALQAGFLNLNNKTLTIGGTVSGTGTFRGSPSSGLSIASSNTVGTLNFDQTNDGSSNALASLVLSAGSASLGTKLNIYTVLNIAGGSLDLAAKNLVLKSNATQTAYVAEIKGTLSGETNVTVERYIPAWSTRRWRLLTAPVLNTTINAAWQEGSSWNGTGTLPATGYGTLITGQQQGTAATANAKGFDFWGAIANGSCSLRSFSPATGTSVATWQNVSSTLTANAFNNNQAYLLFVRGDRSVCIGSAAGVTTLRPNGTLKKGAVTVSVPKENSHTLVGNPYASPLDFKAVYDANSTKIRSSFYTWQSSLGTGSGGYVLMRPITPGSSQYEAIPGNGNASPANRLIHSGEGFFVVPATTATVGNTITIQESHKSAGTPGTQVFRQMGAEDAKLYVNLYDGADNAKVLLDGVLSQYNDTYGMMSGENIAKAANNTENFSIQKGTADAIVSSASLPQAGDTLKFRLWNTTNRTYQLDVKSTNFINEGLTAVLVDRYLKKETFLNLADASTQYTFSVTGDAASKDQSRFYIVFGQAKTLPISITAIKAEAKTTGEVRVQWKVADETDIKYYQVERSVDAVNYTTLATQGTTKGAGEKDYEYLDRQPAIVNYYRIRLSGINGEVKYSSIVKVQLQNTNEAAAVYPNPVSGAVFTLSMQNKPKGTYTMTLYNMAGQQVLRKEWQHVGGTVTESIQLRRDLGAGTYSLEVREAAGKAERLSLSIAR